MTHEIDTLLREARQGGNVTIPEGWGQGRATFGGLVAGLLVARALGELGMLGVEETTLRSVTTNFVAPASPGPARLETEILRQGKSATQLEARLVQPDETGGPAVRAVALMTFGAPRRSSIEVVATPHTPTAPFDELEAIPYLAGMTPDFIAHVDMRPATGGFPFSGRSSGDLTGFMCFRDRTAEFGLPHLVTLIDSWPPAPGQMLEAPAPMSTMTWTLELIAPVTQDPNTLWWYEVVTDAAHEGYGHTQARIYDGEGTLVAVSRQTVALFG